MRMAFMSLRKYAETPHTVKTARENIRVLTFPILSAAIPTRKPNTATPREGIDIMSETTNSLSFGNAAEITGSAGATAAPPIKMSMDAISNTANAILPGLNPCSSDMGIIDF